MIWDTAIYGKYRMVLDGTRDSNTIVRLYDMDEWRLPMMWSKTMKDEEAKAVIAKFRRTGNTKMPKEGATE